MTRLPCYSLLLVAACLAGYSDAAEVGQIKVSKGNVWVERSGGVLPGLVGVRLQSEDAINTGSDGSVSITMTDNSLLSLGPNSLVSLDHYTFDVNIDKGDFAMSIRNGTVSVISGRIAKRSLDAMTVRTPSAVLGVRGTEFCVSVPE